MQEAYGGYDYDVKKEDGSVTADVTIDYEKLNLEKLAKDDPSMAKLLNDDKKLEKDNLQSIYEQLGSECKEVK